MRKIIGDRVYVEGNNGGDFIDLEKYHEDVHDPDSNLVHLEIGNCCVRTITASVPVEFITGTLTEAVLRHGGLREAIMALGWEEDFKRKLVSQVVELDNFNQPKLVEPPVEEGFHYVWIEADSVAHRLLPPDDSVTVCGKNTGDDGPGLPSLKSGGVEVFADVFVLCEECWKGVE